MHKSTLTTLLFILSATYTITAQKKDVSFLFAGDAMQHQSQINTAKKGGEFDYSTYFEKIKEKITTADIAVVNLEVTLAGKPYTGYPQFSAPDEFAVALKDAGFDIFLTANNHCLDRRKKGLERTITVLDSLKVLHSGTFADSTKRELYYPLMMIKNGIRIAMLNYTYDTNGIKVTAPNIVNLIDRNMILKDIATARAMQADIIIANMHWGYEYKLMPNNEQKELANFLIENGVRIVVGNHPHVVQPIDIRYDDSKKIDSVIIYSLGNFVSGMKLVNTTGGMMANISISKEMDKKVTIESCNYSLVWVHKTKDKYGNFNFFELLPPEKYENTEGKEYLGEENYNLMKSFSKTAKKTVEAYWN